MQIRVRGGAGGWRSRRAAAVLAKWSKQPISPWVTAEGEVRVRRKGAGQVRAEG